MKSWQYREEESRQTQPEHSAYSLFWWICIHKNNGYTYENEEEDKCVKFTTISNIIFNTYQINVAYIFVDFSERWWFRKTEGDDHQFYKV